MSRDYRRTLAGFVLKDVLFMFFSGGIATCLYEYFFHEKIKLKKTRKHHFRALLIGSLAALVFAASFQTSPIFPIIIFGLAGAMSVWLERADLIKHSLIGGISFLVVYVCAFSIFNYVFPDFITKYYNHDNLIGLFVGGIPIEELLFALSFGILWAPIYEYEHGEKDGKYRRKS